MARRVLGAAIVAILHVAIVGGAVVAQVPDGATLAAPDMFLDRTAGAPGDAVFVTLTGWPGRAVTLTICGNQALRGSQDCNMVRSESESLNRDDTPTVAHLPIYAPPLPCPCVVRATTRTNEVVDFAPIEIIGHPIAPLVEPEVFDPLSITMQTKRARTGLIDTVRSALGGPTAYDVTVTVQNRSGSLVSGVTVSGAVGRGNDVDGDSAGLQFAPAADLAPGEQRTESSRVSVPAPAVGSFTLSAVAAGGGPVATASDSVKHVPFPLLILLAVLAGDLVAIVMRRRRKRLEDRADEGDEPEDDEVVDAMDDATRVPVGAL